MSQRRRMRLGLSATSTGLFSGAWRRKNAPDTRNWPDPSAFIEAARVAEAGRFDVFFLADAQRIEPEGAVWSPPYKAFEPTLLLTAVAQHTRHIGLVATATTSYTHPFNLARRLATLDQLSNGRAAWNVVVSAAADINFGPIRADGHALRYERAEEFLQVVKALWGSWRPGAVLADPVSGRFIDPEKLSPIHFRGRFFEVEGPLDTPPGPQGVPVISQAGSSETGLELGVRHADFIFTAHSVKATAQSFYAKVHAASARQERALPPLVMPGMNAVIGRSEAEARELRREMMQYIDFDSHRSAMQGLLGGGDLSGFDLDEALPAEYFPPASAIEGRRSRFELYRQLSLEEGYTLRQLIEAKAATDGHWHLIGTAESIANSLIDWFDSGAADGFNYQPAYMPEALDDFVGQVVPILQERGYVQQDYAPGTLREKLRS